MFSCLIRCETCRFALPVVILMMIFRKNTHKIFVGVLPMIEAILLSGLEELNTPFGNLKGVLPANPNLWGGHC